MSRLAHYRALRFTVSLKGHNIILKSCLLLRLEIWKYYYHLWKAEYFPITSLASFKSGFYCIWGREEGAGEKMRQFPPSIIILCQLEIVIWKGQVRLSGFLNIQKTLIFLYWKGCNSTLEYWIFSQQIQNCTSPISQGCSTWQSSTHKLADLSYHRTSVCTAVLFSSCSGIYSVWMKDFSYANQVYMDIWLQWLTQPHNSWFAVTQTEIAHLNWTRSCLLIFHLQCSYLIN